MKTEKSLYIKILIWAYNRQELGFTWSDLQKEFNLTKEQEQWVQKVFRSNIPISENLIDHLNYNSKKDEHLFVITSKGTSEATKYIDSKKWHEKFWGKVLIGVIIAGIIYWLGWN